MQQPELFSQLYFAFMLVNFGRYLKKYFAILLPQTLPIRLITTLLL